VVGKRNAESLVSTPMGIELGLKNVPQNKQEAGYRAKRHNRMNGWLRDQWDTI